jgi:hypothetical protein
MALSVQPYPLHTIQNFIRHSVSLMDERHQRWRLIEAIYRTGSLAQAEQVQAGRLQDFFPLLSEHAVNLVLPHINIIMASVVSREPQFLTIPYAGGDEAEKSADVAQAVINYFWRRLRVTDELKDATHDAIKLGSGFLKVGWTHLEQEMQVDELERKSRALDEYERRRIDAMMNEQEFEGNIEAMKRSVPHSEMQVIRSEPFVEYVSPYDIFIPTNARRLVDSRWVVHRLTLPVDEILSNPEFNITEEQLVRDGTSLNIGDEYQAEWRRQAEDAKGIHSALEALDTATIWEFYDMRTRRLTVCQLEGEEPLWEGDLPWAHRYPPFVHIRNFRSAGHDFWGFGDIENIANIQSMFNEFLTEQMENARRSGQKYLISKDAISEELIAALESTESDVVAPIDVPNGQPLSEIIVPVARMALSNDIYAAKAELERYMQEVLGINDFQAGGVGANRMSATAAAVVEGVATLRAQDKIQSIEDSAAQVGNLILLLCQEYLDEPTAIRIAGIEGAMWPEITKADIYGEFLVSVEGGSMKSLNPATREQQGLRMLQLVVPTIAQLGFDPNPALRTAIRDLGYNPDEILVPAEQPTQIGQPQEPGQASATAQLGAMGAPPQAQMAQEGGQISL